MKDACEKLYPDCWSTVADSTETLTQLILDSTHFASYPNLHVCCEPISRHLVYRLHVTRAAIILALNWLLFTLLDIWMNLNLQNLFSGAPNSKEGSTLPTNHCKKSDIVKSVIHFTRVPKTFCLGWLFNLTCFIFYLYLLIYFFISC